MTRRTVNASDGRRNVQGLYPIRTVARITGVNPVTLRAWERRYGLIKPRRTPSGHRVYTEEHVELVRQILALLDSGVSIGQVAEVIDTQRAPPDLEDTGDAWAGYRRRMVEGVANFDETTLEGVYAEAVSLYPVDVVSEHLIVPTLRELGWRWQNRTGTVAQEHFFSTYIRNKLGARLHHRTKRARGPKVILSCLPNERHDTGLLLFGLAALDHGLQAVLLGADLPLDELPIAANQSGAIAVVLAGKAEPAGYDLGDKLRDLTTDLDIPVYVGGRVSRLCEEAIEGAGARVLGDNIFAALRHVVADVRPQ